MHTKRFIVWTLCSLAVLLSASLVVSKAKLDEQVPATPDSVALETTDVEEDTATETSTISPPLVYTLTIEGAIGTVTDDRIEEAIEIAEENNAQLLVIFLDTPGGFTKPTWSICKSILNANIPVCVYISPLGARAGSAGVYITYSAHFAAMAPSTNIGAAHPVAGSGEEIDSVMNEKITNDAVAQIRAAAQKRGRNAEWAEKAVRESISITDQEALELNVIDIRAENLADLLSQIDGREADLPLGKKIVQVVEAQTKEIEISFVQKVLRIITDPNIAFILFSIGSLGIVLELYNPGSILPGVVGSICLLLALYSFQTLPINYAGLALIILAIMLFIAEIKIISHGLLTIGGIISLFLGGMMLIDTVEPFLRISLSVLITVVVLFVISFALVSWLVMSAHRRQPSVGQEGLLGKIAEVRPHGFVFVDGALWKAVSNEDLEVGSNVKIVSVDKLTLKVKRTDS